MIKQTDAVIVGVIYWPKQSRKTKEIKENIANRKD